MVIENDTRQDSRQADIRGVGQVNDRPTLGATLRARGLEPGMCDEAKVLYAYEVVQAARRLEMSRRMEGMFAGLNASAEPEIIARRMRRLADQVDPYYDCRCQRNWHPHCPVHDRDWDPDAA